MRLLDTFKLKKRNYCLVFEELEMNLFELLESKKDDSIGGGGKQMGMNLQFIKMVGWQILVALSLLSMPNINVIHSDLKPENIMLREQGKTGIKLIDFGNACYSNKKIFKYVQSRYYRSPEVIMELPYSTSVDSWSVGCILYELHFGEPLFKGKGLEKFD